MLNSYNNQCRRNVYSNLLSCLIRCHERTVKYWKRLNPTKRTELCMSKLLMWRREDEESMSSWIVILQYSWTRTFHVFLLSTFSHDIKGGKNHLLINYWYLLGFFSVMLYINTLMEQYLNLASLLCNELCLMTAT